MSISDVDLVPTWFDCEDDADNAMRLSCLFAGLEKHLIENMRYPEDALAAGVFGKVMVRFIVKKNGEIVDTQIAYVAVDKGDSSSLEAEALRLMKSCPNVIPAQFEGKGVATELMVPVKFEKH